MKRLTPLAFGELDGQPWIRPFGARAPAKQPDSPSELYHEHSKYHRALMVREVLDSDAALSLERRSERSGLALPAPSEELPLSLGQVLRRRRSVRQFQPTPLPLQVLADLLYYTAGVTGGMPMRVSGQTLQRPLRTYPSGGALYSVELFLMAQRVHGLEAGAYCYNPTAHALVPVPLDTVRLASLQSLSPMPRGIVDLTSPPVLLVPVGVFRVEHAKYGRRALRFVLQESGHLAQNALLVATALGLGSVVMGAFYDDELNRLLGLDGTEESALYLIPVGEPQHPAAPGVETERPHG